MLILLASSGLLARPAGGIAVILGFPSIFLLCWVPCALNPMPASSPLYSFVLSEVTATSAVRPGRENLKFCLLFFFKARNPLFLFPLHHPDKALSWAWPREGRWRCVPCTSRVLSAPTSPAMVTKKEQPLLLCHCQEILRSPVKSWECVWRLGDQWL